MYTISYDKDESSRNILEILCLFLSNFYHVHELILNLFIKINNVDVSVCSYILKSLGLCNQRMV